MAKLKKHRKWIILAAVLLLVLLWYSEWPRPLLKDPANTTLVDGIGLSSVCYYKEFEPIYFYPDTDFDMEELRDLFGDRIPA